ncbi:hypothetical protein [Paractinoplanes aksuensis]|uniref:hypothetical protein n=1 Tax=Paractinoplanes aksuensis TaxID=2939490 RepID=UPI00209C4AD0|nr:hypothetical protein [Actinoplanes aksuensis]
MGVPGGESVLGAAPTTARTTPVAVRYSAGPYRPKPSTLPASAVPQPFVPTTSPVVISTSPSPTPPPVVVPSGVSEPPLPPLDEPPVPTPTDPSEASTPPDAEPPSSAPSSTELPTLFP